MTTYATEAESPFNENEVTDLAAELLGVSNDQELDKFLGGLLRRAASAVGGALHSPMLHPLGALAKGAVRKILPGIGRAFSGLVDPTGNVDQGGHIGQLAARASKLLGIELEGLSGEDQEFAAAKQLVRLAGTAAAEVALSPAPGNSTQTARQAVIQAAQVYAPGLLRSASSHRQSHHEHSHSHGQSQHDCGCGGSCGGCGGGSKAGSGISGGETRSGSWIRRGHEIILEDV